MHLTKIQISRLQTFLTLNGNLQDNSGKEGEWNDKCTEAYAHYCQNTHLNLAPNNLDALPHILRDVAEGIISPTKQAENVKEFRRMEKRKREAREQASIPKASIDAVKALKLAEAKRIRSMLGGKSSKETKAIKQGNRTINIEGDRS